MTIACKLDAQMLMHRVNCHEHAHYRAQFVLRSLGGDANAVVEPVVAELKFRDLAAEGWATTNVSVRQRTRQTKPCV